MSTFIGQLVGFALIVEILRRYVAPPIRRLMAGQRETVRNQLDENATAAHRLADADRFHAQRVAQARSEAAHIIDEARSDSVRIKEQLLAQADVEVERIKVQGGQQVQLLRAQTLRQLRGDLGADALRGANALVREHVSDPQARSATVDRFLDELDAMAPAAFTPEVTSTLRSASRDAQAAVVERVDAVAAGMSGDALSTLSDELATVAGLLVREPILARHLAQTSGAAQAKKQMLERLLGGKVGDAALDVLNTAVSMRWSSTADLVDSIQHAARLSLLARAQREDQADEVEEQLFRFSRILEAQPQLITLLSDYAAPAPERLSLLRTILGTSSGVNSTAAALLTQTVALLHGDRADEAVLELAQLAVARRGEIVAQVSAAAELSDAQRTRLTAVLSRIYNHPVSVQVNTDPELLGGMSVAVGDEVIDGTLSARLAAAQTKLPN